MELFLARTHQHLAGALLNPDHFAFFIFHVLTEQRFPRISSILIALPRYIFPSLFLTYMFFCALLTSFFIFVLLYFLDFVLVLEFCSDN